MKRREFVKYIGCGCCSFSLASCSSAPITNRKQITFYPESVINRKAAQAYEKFKKKAKISKDTETLKLIKSIGSKMEVAISSYFKINELLPGYTSLPYVRSSYSRYVPVVKFKYCTTVGYFRVVP